jgi:uncharacterized membrane protein YqjE
MFPGSDAIEEVFPQLKRVGEYARVLFAGVQHRAELAAIEFAEARTTVVACAVWWAVAFMLLMLGAATLTAGVAAAFWDTHYRLVALAVMAVTYLAGAAFCFLRVRRHLRCWQPFRDTAGQLRKDALCLGDLIHRP